MAVHIAVDGSNLAGRDDGKGFDLSRLEAAIAVLQSIQDVSLLRVFVDASFRWKCSADEKARLEVLIQNGTVSQTPAGLPADDFILDWAARIDALVVSNDKFKPYETTYPWVSQTGAGRMVAAMFDESSKHWSFREKNPGSGPARSIVELIHSRPVPLDQFAPTESQTLSSAPLQYQRKVTPANPSAIVLLLDQSKSMLNEWAHGKSRAQVLVDAVNTSLYELVLQSTRGGKVKDFLDVAVIGYRKTATGSLYSLLPNTSIHDPFVSISQLAKGFLRLDSEETPVWVDGYAEGQTPMREVFAHVTEVMRVWAQSHPDAFPPIVVNITDGEPTDGDPAPEARDIQGIETSDGGVLIFNMHVTNKNKGGVSFPVDLSGDSDKFLKLLYECSSVIPESLVATATACGLRCQKGSRGLLVSGQAADIAAFINFGTTGSLPTVAS